MRPCPQNIAEPLLRILELGILAIRSMGFAKRSDLCAIQADHLHNLPSLLEDYSDDRLLYYWDTERIAFMNKTNSDDRRFFEEPWSHLESVVQSLRSKSQQPLEIAGSK